MFAGVISQSSVAQEPSQHEKRWGEAIAAFEEQDRNAPPPKQAILFIGSSSIRGWDLGEYFPDDPVLNRGFGGSELADSAYFADRIIFPYEPRAIVLYAGDNDIANGKSPERVFEDFKAFVAKVHERLPRTPVLFVAIKPSIRRWGLVEDMRWANRLIAEYAQRHPLLHYVDIDTPMIGDDGRPRPELFVEDGLHLSATGYRLWTGKLKPVLEQALASIEDVDGPGYHAVLDANSGQSVKGLHMNQAGFAATCITPPPGREIPGLFHKRIAEGTLDDLYARAVVIDDGEKRVAMVQVDTIKVSEDLVASARKQAQALCGIPGRNCFIAATHTHSGGPSFAGFGAAPDDAYREFVAVQVAGAIAEANHRLRPVLVGTDACPAEGIAFNRRFVMKDGTQTTHPGKMNPDIECPAGPADPTVTVVGFIDPETLQAVGCVVNFACHATHVNGYLYSADYPKYIVDTLQAVYGGEFGVVFLNGACGDVTQVDNQSPRPGEFGDYWCRRTGQAVGGAALVALARMDPYGAASTDVRSARVRAGIREITAEQKKAARELLAKKKPTAKDIETIYASELLEVDKMRRKNAHRNLEIQLMRIADAVFWGVPGEFFQAFAKDVKDASPFPHTCCVELANGYNGYICTPEAFGGGYEPRTARSSFLEPEAGPKIVAAAKRLVKVTHESAAGELETLPERRVWTAVEDEALDGINQLKKNE